MHLNIPIGCRSVVWNIFLEGFPGLDWRAGLFHQIMMQLMNKNA